MLFERDPPCYFLFKAPARLLVGHKACLEGLKSIGILVLQVKAQVDLAHATHYCFVNEIAPTNLIALTVARKCIHSVHLSTRSRSGALVRNATSLSHLCVVTLPCYVGEVPASQCQLLPLSKKWCGYSQP